MLTLTENVSIVYITDRVSYGGEVMIRENVKKIRESKGVTKTHVAKELGLSPMGYGHIESGNVRLDADRLKDIAKILSVEPAIFFDDQLTENVIKEMKLSKTAI